MRLGVTGKYSPATLRVAPTRRRIAVPSPGRSVPSTRSASCHPVRSGRATTLTVQVSPKVSAWPAQVLPVMAKEPESGPSSVGALTATGSLPLDAYVTVRGALVTCSGMVGKAVVPLAGTPLVRIPAKPTAECHRISPRTTDVSHSQTRSQAAANVVMAPLSSLV